MKLTLATTVILLALAPALHAQPVAPTEPVPPTETAVAPTQTQEQPTNAVDARSVAPSAFGDLDSIGIAVSAGGGVSGFTSELLRDSANDGGSWDVRVTFGTRRILALEASYLGSAQRVDAFGLNGDALLVSNGVQGNLRFNVFGDRRFVQPFLYAGVAVRRYDLSNVSTNTSNVRGSDNVFEVPLGLGLGARTGSLLFEARGEFRTAMDEDLVGSMTGIDADNNAAQMHRYGATLNVGYEF